MASSSCMSCSSSASLADYELKSNKQINAYYNMIALFLIHLPLLTSVGTLPFTI